MRKVMMAGVLCVVLVVTLVSWGIYSNVIVNDKAAKIESLKKEVTSLYVQMGFDDSKIDFYNNLLKTTLSTLNTEDKQIAKLEEVKTQLEYQKTIDEYFFGVPNNVTKEIQIQSIGWYSNTNTIKVFVQNVGDLHVTLSSVYVNGELDSAAIISPKDLGSAMTSTITLSGTYVSAPSQITVKVVTIDDIFSESTKTFP